VPNTLHRRGSQNVNELLRFDRKIHNLRQHHPTLTEDLRMQISSPVTFGGAMPPKVVP
jgi:hypothetical protein